MTDRPFFCSLPWTSLDIHAQGNIRPCCKFNTVVARNLKDYYESEILQEVKKVFMQGGKPQQCQRCWQEESVGLPSKRQLDHQYVLRPFTHSEDIQTVSLTFGNICNLACVTCNSSSSSRWLQDERQLFQQFKHLDQMHIHDKHYRDTDFVDQLIERCNHLEHLTISGGEPFLSNRAVHLDLLARMPRPEKVKIHYVTNGTVFPDSDFWHIWRNFKQIEISLSIDAIEQRFEYLRYPANWSEVLQNIDQYKKQKQIQISISHTVSWLNVLGLDEFATWCLKQNLPLPYIGPVNHPNFLSVKSLPVDAKNYVKVCLSGGKWQGTKKILDLMFTDDQSKFFNQGVRWLRALDKLRDKNFLQVFPELSLVTQSHIDKTVENF